VKAARLRPRAEQELLDATQYYGQKGGAPPAERAFYAALSALGPIQRMPGLGSRRIGQGCDVPGLRAWAIGGFPMHWFYFGAEDHLDVVRLLGDRQDITTILSEGA
jgi:toxin ParE1/3/4